MSRTSKAMGIALHCACLPISRRSGSVATCSKMVSWMSCQVILYQDSCRGPSRPRYRAEATHESAMMILPMPENWRSIRGHATQTGACLCSTARACRGHAVSIPGGTQVPLSL